MSSIRSRLSGMFGIRSSAPPDSPSAKAFQEEEEEPIEEPEEEEAAQLDESSEEEVPLPVKRKRVNAKPPPAQPQPSTSRSSEKKASAPEEESEEEMEKPLTEKVKRVKRDPPPFDSAVADPNSRDKGRPKVRIGDLPTVDQWNNAKAFKKCQLPTRGVEDAIRISVGDAIFIKPGEQEVAPATPSKANGKGKAKLVAAAKTEVWLGRVNEIRAVDKHNVYMSINWYYSGPQIKAVNFKHAKQLDLQKGELVLTDHKDVIAVASCNDVATVYEYYEDNLNQAQIAADDYFVRREELVFAPKGKQSSHEPFVAPSCHCGKPYAIASTMRYCPRPTCQKWSHSACLPSIPREIPDTLTYLTAIPTTPIFDASPPPIKKSPRGRPSNDSLAGATAASAFASSPSSIEAAYTPALLSIAPLALFSLASQPIVRGGTKHGIVGNAQFVLRARQLLKEFVKKDGELEEGWGVQLGLEEDGEVVGKKGVGAAVGTKGRKEWVWEGEGEREECFECEGCGGKI